MGYNSAGPSVGSRAAAAAADEEDPLDAFMRTQVEAKAREEKELAERHLTAWEAQYGNKDVTVSDVLEEEKNMNLHCYVCKKWGHTKRDCPHKRCKHCGKEGHVKEDCPELNAKIEKQFDDEKARKRARQYAKKKEKRAAEWEAKLREKTGVDGFVVLYEILGLPPRKLATKEEIRRAYRVMSLRYHPDKVPDEEVEEAKEKFVAIQMAYELLCEGMETGGEGMKGAVFSGGDLEYTCSEMAPAASTNLGAETSAPSEAALEGATIAPAAATATVDLAGDALMHDAASVRASTVASADSKNAQTSVVGSVYAQDVLKRKEVDVLLHSPKVQAALLEISAQPAAVLKYSRDAVLLGLLYTLSTDGWEVACTETGSVPGGTDRPGLHPSKVMSELGCHGVGASPVMDSTGAEVVD